MKKLKYFICIALVLFLGVGFSGCFLSDLFVTISLSTPRLSLDAEEDTLSWSWDADAVSYTLYDDSTPLDTFTTEEEGYSDLETLVTHTIEIADYVSEYKEYNFKVQAYISSEINKFSNEIVYLHKNPNVVKDATYGKVINFSSLAPQNVTYSNYTLSWDEVAGATKYYVCAIYSKDSVYSFETTATSANVFDYVSNGITVFRVASNMGTNESYFSDMVTVNTAISVNPYKQVYYFNGEFNDYYINSSQELIKVLYYSFIAKDESVDVRFTSAGLTEVMGSEISLTSAVIGNYIDAITETCYYDFSYEKSGSIYDYNFAFDFNGYAEPTTHNDNVSAGTVGNNVLNQSDLIKPYYENYTFTSRADDYSDFVSDNQIIVVSCKTSEELYWAVEGGATPMFTSTTSTAYTLYQNAKNVLIDVISNQMTEYEKVLSIYDYISYSSVYDYAALSKSTPTKYKCFYLESLLEEYAGTKVAVCDGYSKTFALLCNMEGIDAYRVTGMAKTSSGVGAHAWNKVKVGENWYVVDITWTESTLVDSDASTYYTSYVYEILGHSYFLVNDDFVLANHFAYASETDRARYTNLYGFSSFTTYFPSVYMEVEIHSSTNFLDYYSNTKFTNTSTPTITHDHIIDTVTEAQALVLHLTTNNVPSVEFLISSTVTDAVKQSIIDVILNAGYVGYELYTSELTYASTSTQVAGMVYVFGLESAN